MPKVSVIIIYYNEALSTLLRNVVQACDNEATFDPRTP
jgi:glycosyltransferase involved in cell wall biosynthesis